MKQGIVQKRSWERQPGESAKAYEAFASYRDLGSERSIQKVSQQCTKNVSLLKRWCSRWNWVERTRAWDNELTREAKAYAEKQIQSMLERHVKIAFQLQRQALEALESLEIEQLSPKDILSFLRLATELERLNREAEMKLAELYSLEKDSLKSTYALVDFITQSYTKRIRDN